MKSKPLTFIYLRTYVHMFGHLHILPLLIMHTLYLHDVAIHLKITEIIILHLHNLSYIRIIKSHTAGNIIAWTLRIELFKLLLKYNFKDDIIK